MLLSPPQFINIICHVMLGLATNYFDWLCLTKMRFIYFLYETIILAIEWELTVPIPRLMDQGNRMMYAFSIARGGKLIFKGLCEYVIK